LYTSALFPAPKKRRKAGWRSISNGATACQHYGGSPLAPVAASFTTAPASLAIDGLGLINAFLSLPKKEGRIAGIFGGSGLVTAAKCASASAREIKKSVSPLFAEIVPVHPQNPPFSPPCTTLAVEISSFHLGR
jgi:hypothetical protein